ncbi:methylphosphotriester-DNA--protein-cysteine methyltransferase family protein [Paenibacillus athensensis]|uniref:HTH araC/xylS-type domain-containing protein n=1 Tax=Paenibacillus athensensis TaxID=1967502 RepID=A0A4Y8PXN8_9BACL|nr:Ada metal-binding domain-containing protein [Paenibacillus athensensis]MCD1261489.1 methylphosphotriester-DNA--protein-cysteine methyltransferase family protein [Paenibacillus athensensis]
MNHKRPLQLALSAEQSGRLYVAVLERDTAYDGIYIMGVCTTGICCRLSCRSRTPKPEHIVFYAGVREAVADGFRPCKRCRPESGGALSPDLTLVAEAKRLIGQRLNQPFTLTELAALLNLSAFHLQRVFSRACGQSPAQYALELRIAEARRLLAHSKEPMAAIARQVGFRSASYFAAAFQRITGSTPSAYREQASLPEPAGDGSLHRTERAAPDSSIRPDNP